MLPCIGVVFKALHEIRREPEHTQWRCCHALVLGSRLYMRLGESRYIPSDDAAMHWCWVQCFTSLGGSQNLEAITGQWGAQLALHSLNTKHITTTKMVFFKFHSTDAWVPFRCYIKLFCEKLALHRPANIEKSRTWASVSCYACGTAGKHQAKRVPQWKGGPGGPPPEIKIKNRLQMVQSELFWSFICE